MENEIMLLQKRRLQTSGVCAGGTEISDMRTDGAGIRAGLSAVLLTAVLIGAAAAPEPERNQAGWEQPEAGRQYSSSLERSAQTDRRITPVRPEEIKQLIEKEQSGVAVLNLQKTEFSAEQEIPDILLPETESVREWETPDVILPEIEVPEKQETPDAEFPENPGSGTDVGGNTGYDGAGTDGSTENGGAGTDGSTENGGAGTDGNTENGGAGTDGNTENDGAGTDGSTENGGADAGGSTESGEHTEAGGSAVTNGFLIDSDGMIYGVNPDAINVSDGYLSLPSAGCTGIRNGALSGIGDGVQEVFIPSNISLIEAGAFAKLNGLSWIEAEAGNPCYISKDGVLFDAAMTTVLSFPKGRTDTYVVPAGVTGIGSCAFAETSVSCIDMWMCKEMELGDDLFGGHDGSGIVIKAPAGYEETYRALFASYQVQVM